MKDDEPVEVACGQRDERELPETFVDYEEKPREYTLSAISTVLDVHTRVSDLYSQPFDQIREQLRLTIESVKERQESELVNSDDYGLLKSAAPSMRVKTRAGPPDTGRSRRADLAGLEGAGVLPGAPARDRCVRTGVHATRRSAGDGDDVRLAVPHVARHPAHPVRQAARRRQGARGRWGGQDQHPLAAHGREDARESSGSSSRACPASRPPVCRSASWGSTGGAIASYLISLYCSAAVLTDDALGVLEHVEVGSYHDYK